MSFSIIIPSRNVDNLTACVRRLREMGETARVIVVDDNIQCSWPEYFALAGAATVVKGFRPFCFARNCNMGIRAAGDNDVILLNDDVLLETPDGLTHLAQYADTGSYAGVIASPRVRGPAHPVHMKRPQDPMRTGTPVARGHFLPFACVMIPRKILTAVGELDEQFTPGGYEDNDYSWRAQKAGFMLIVDNSVIVDHQTLPHTFRPAGKPDLYDLAANKKRFEDKWKDRK